MIELLRCVKFITIMIVSLGFIRQMVAITMAARMLPRTRMFRLHIHISNILMKRGIQSHHTASRNESRVIDCLEART